MRLAWSWSLAEAIGVNGDELDRLLQVVQRLRQFDSRSASLLCGVFFLERDAKGTTQLRQIQHIQFLGKSTRKRTCAEITTTETII